MSDNLKRFRYYCPTCEIVITKISTSIQHRRLLGHKLEKYPAKPACIGVVWP